MFSHSVFSDLIRPGIRAVVELLWSTTGQENHGDAHKVAPIRPGKLFKQPRFAPRTWNRAGTGFVVR